MGISNDIKEVNDKLNDILAQVKRINSAYKGTYTFDEVRELLSTQRSNCYVAVLNKLNSLGGNFNDNQKIASVTERAPEPGGDIDDQAWWGHKNNFYE